MIQLIALIIFLISVSVVSFIICKKIPSLVALPYNGQVGFKKPEFISRLEKIIKDNHCHFFKKQMLLHKLLSMIKVWVLKIERNVDILLHGIRKKAQEVDRELKDKK